MRIILSPAAAFTDDTPPSVSGDTITYRGEQYDLSQLPDGGEVDAELPFIGKIKRVNGEVELTLQYKYDTTTAESNQPADWADYTFTVVNGECPCPILRKPEPEPVVLPEVEESQNDN